MLKRVNQYHMNECMPRLITRIKYVKVSYLAMIVQFEIYILRGQQ